MSSALDFSLSFQSVSQGWDGELNHLVERLMYEYRHSILYMYIPNSKSNKIYFYFKDWTGVEWYDDGMERGWKLLEKQVENKKRIALIIHEEEGRGLITNRDLRELYNNEEKRKTRSRRSRRGLAARASGTEVVEQVEDKVRVDSESEEYKDSSEERIGEDIATAAVPIHWSEL